ncbi:conserved hypothetical protein [Desulfovibrionales bacterium]
MTPYELIQLQVRLKNCLQTIVDLEPDLRRIELGQMLLMEYKVLKAFLERLNDASLVEDDVSRIERATESFLNELRMPLASVCIVSTRLQFIH